MNLGNNLQLIEVKLSRPSRMEFDPSFTWGRKMPLSASFIGISRFTYEFSYDYRWIKYESWSSPRYYSIE